MRVAFYFVLFSFCLALQAAVLENSFIHKKPNDINEWFQDAVNLIMSGGKLYLNRLTPINATTGFAQVATYTNDPNFIQPSFVSFTTSEDVWVSSQGEAQKICNTWKLNGDDLKIRLNQLHGLRPNDQFTHFVTMLVSVDSLFRPAVDPNITTFYPCGNMIELDCGEIFPFNVPEDYRQRIISWLNNTSGLGPRADGYPWTGLGYTYDWNPENQDTYGVSEYIIKAGSNITIVDVVLDEDYCNLEL